MNRTPVRLFGLGCLLALGLGVFVALFARLWPYLTDDTFISIRYAKNLAEGHGLVYNPGERVEGYTNFLWTLWLAVPVAFRWPVVPFIKFSNALLTVATAALLVPLSRVTLLGPQPVRPTVPAGEAIEPESPPPGRTSAAAVNGAELSANGWQWTILPTVLLLATPLAALGAADGLETALFGFLLVLSATCFFTESADRALPLSALALAALAMTRPDGVLFALLFGVMAVVMRRPRKYVLRFAAWFAVLFGTYFVLRGLYYGHPLPNTFYAKGGGDAFLLLRGWEELRRFVIESGGWAWLLIPTSWIHRKTRVIALALTGVVVLRVLFQLWSGGPWMGRYRFLIPVLPFVSLLVIGGIAQFARRGAVRVIVTAAAMAAFLLPGWKDYPGLEQASLGYAYGLHHGHFALGRAINEHTRTDALMAMDDAGIGPLVADRRNLDMLGLNDEHIAHLRGRYADKFDMRYVLARRPDLIVLIAYVEQPTQDADFRLPGHAALFRAPEFRAHYRFMRRFTFAADYHLLVYRRLDSTAAPEDF